MKNAYCVARLTNYSCMTRAQTQNKSATPQMLFIFMFLHLSLNVIIFVLAKTEGKEAHHVYSLADIFRFGPYLAEGIDN